MDEATGDWKAAYESDIGDWAPPSEAELKIIAARRERGEKISQLLADYLLKGYKMLSTYCQECQTVLLQDKQQKLHCVACSEVDNEHSKDNPALNDEAARKLMAESQLSGGQRVVGNGDDAIISQSSGHNSRDERNVILHSSPSEDTTQAITSSNETSTEPCPSRSDKSDVDEISEAIHAIQKKITWSSQKLNKNTTADGSLRWCNVLKACAETILLLKQIQDQDTQ